MGPVLLWGPPLGDDPGAAVKSSSLLVVSTLNSTDIFLILAGKICYLPNSGWALAVKIKILGFPDRAILLIQTLHYMVINGYNGRNPRCDNNLGKLERYRLVTIGGGNGTGPEPPFPVVYIQSSWMALYCRCPPVS